MYANTLWSIDAIRIHSHFDCITQTERAADEHIFILQWTYQIFVSRFNFYFHFSIHSISISTITMSHIIRIEMHGVRVIENKPTHSQCLHWEETERKSMCVRSWIWHRNRIIVSHGYQSVSLKLCPIEFYDKTIRKKSASNFFSSKFQQLLFTVNRNIILESRQFTYHFTVYYLPEKKNNDE